MTDRAGELWEAAQYVHGFLTGAADAIREYPDATSLERAAETMEKARDRLAEPLGIVRYPPAQEEGDDE